jgi:hypothetical protein
VVGRRVNEEYPKIAARDNQVGAEVQRGDETGLRSDDVLHPTDEDLFAGAPFCGRGYAPKGMTSEALADANVERLSVISMETNQGWMRWKVFSGAMNAKAPIGFPKRLTHGRKLRNFLILDNLRVHHSKAVNKRLEANADNVVVFFPPGYSPELNPDELLNAGLKQRVTKAAPAVTKMALTRTAIGALRCTQKQPERVERYLKQKVVSYAPHSIASGPDQSVEIHKVLKGWEQSRFNCFHQ